MLPKVTSLKQFNWLEGRWKMENKEVYELWQTMNDTLMTGMGYHIELEEEEPGEFDEEVKFDESIRFVKREKDFFYIPRTVTQNNGHEIEFKIVSSTKTSFLAINPKHDFPQRIFYERKDEKRLHAYIEGVVNGKNKRIDFHFIKINQ